MYLPNWVAMLATISSMAVVLGSNLCPAKPAVNVGCSCPSEWQLWHNACYRITPSWLPWDDAKEDCRNMGGKMAAPWSPEEMKLMVDLAKQDNSNGVWVACNDKETEGTWMCDDQEPSWSSLEWAPGQPDDKIRINGQDCACIASYYNYTLDDVSCIAQFKSMCVRQADCPRPTTQPRRYCLSTDTHGRIPNSTCLLDHTIREFITEGVAACGSVCIKEPGCGSFNIKKDGGGKKICQLNNSTSLEDKDKFQKTDYFCIYSKVCMD